MSDVVSPSLDAALKAADDAFFEALLSASVNALDALLDDEFMIVDLAKGGVYDRATFLGGVAAGMIVFKSIERFYDEAIVRALGDEGGVVIGRTQMSIVAQDGSEIETESRYTHVFRRDGERWRLFSAQGTQIAA
jgi:ketosteroid isomerase-like protein